MSSLFRIHTYESCKALVSGHLATVHAPLLLPFSFPSPSSRAATSPSFLRTHLRTHISPLLEIVIRLFFVLRLAQLGIYEHVDGRRQRPGRARGAHQQVEELFARPEPHGFDDGGLRQLEVVETVARVGAVAAYLFFFQRVRSGLKCAGGSDSERD